MNICIIDHDADAKQTTVNGLNQIVSLTFHFIPEEQNDNASILSARQRKQL